MCTQLMSHDKGPLVDQDMPWLFVPEIKTNVAAILWSDRANPPNQKGWETLRCGLEQYFDLAQLLICRWEGKGRTPPVIYVALLNRSNPFEVKAIWGANQHTTPSPPSFGFVWKWTQKCEKPDEGKQSIILTHVPAFENGCVMTNVVLIINPMPFPHLPVS